MVGHRQRTTSRQSSVGRVRLIFLETPTADVLRSVLYTIIFPLAGPLWSQWLQSMRKPRLKSREGGEAATAATLATIQPILGDASSPRPAASDVAKSHISETPVKNKGRCDDIEYTSRQGIERDGVAQVPSAHNSWTRARQSQGDFRTGCMPLECVSSPLYDTDLLPKQLASPVRARAPHKSRLTPRKTPSRQVVKRQRKDSRYAGAVPSPCSASTHC